ncbi:MAG: hypothetical protein ACLFR7_09180 [Opitutales bacterium]
MVLTRAEEERDEAQRHYLRLRADWRAGQDRTSGARAAVAATLEEIAARRASAPGGLWEQGYTSFAAQRSRQLRELEQVERKLAREAEGARRLFVQAALKVRVWESLREHYFAEYAVRERRREEAELEDWTRANFNRARRRTPA